MFQIKITRQPAAADNGEISTKEEIAMLSKEVQDLIDTSRKQTDYIKSVDSAVAALKAQNEAMKAKIEEISNQPPTQAPVDPTVPAPSPTVVYSLSEEDKAALLDVAKEFDDAINTLKDDIPANTPAAAPAPAPAPIPDPETQAKDGAAAAAATPLPGTGVPADAPAEAAPATSQPGV